MKYPGKQFKRLCGATDGYGSREGLFGRCTLPRGHAPGPMAWHQEMRGRRLWAEWRGPISGAVCGLCGKDGAHH